MGDRFPKVRAAVVQAAAVVMDREATVHKAVRLIDQAASQGARLIVFPEAFIPAYPWGVRFGTRIGGRTLEGRKAWARYWANAVDVPGPVTEAIGVAARRTEAYVAIGVIERDSTFSRGTVYCTLLYFGPDGRLVAKHRKLMPTAGERYIWGAGDGSTLPVIETPFGRLGGLICWENYMPMARMAMYGKGVDLYVSPTADTRDTWQATIRHIACEGRCFVLSACQFVTKDMYTADFETLDELDGAPHVLARGGSAIVAPLGEYLAGPLFDEEGILTADLDLAAVVQGRFDFDVAGHYARPDVFRLTVNERPAPPVQTVQWGPEAEVTPAT